MEMMLAVSRIVAVCLASVTFEAALSAAATWSYEGQNGPHYWHELFPQACSGKHQSPIDIRPARTIYDPSLNDFAIWFDPPRPGSTLLISNNGHTVQVLTKGEFYVANGGLPYVYRTVQFHFHWGHAKHHGSEHLIDSHAFPLELHIVSYNSDLYSRMSQAATEKQGLAMLGVLFQVSDKDNPDLEPIINAMDQIKDPEAAKDVEIEAMSLRKLLPRDSTQYYRYNGSVTTPGCFESVVWTVFAQPRPISHRQMHKFRQMLQPRFHHRDHAHYLTKRSASHDVMPVTRREKRRERRALTVLDELALSSDQKTRFRRELMHAKKQADSVTAKIDEQNAGKTHRRMMEAVHQSPPHQDPQTEAPAQNLSELEVEFIQQKLVNNFRPVQPLNNRLVYRSFLHLPKTIAEYVRRTFLRLSSQLLASPHTFKAVKLATVRRWVQTVLQEAGVTSRAGSTRVAAASCAFLNDVPLQTLMNWADWSRQDPPFRL
ncbi:hypothetical protein ACOMHN_029943 [Nucella lapillus]